MSTLTAVHDRLAASPHAGRLSLIDTRLILSTGVNLKEVKPAQNADAALVVKVQSALCDMGINY